jgi:hypothetical protein
VQEIADRAETWKEFLDEFARTFTTANSSSYNDMLLSNVAAPRGHPADAYLPNTGIRPEFRADESGQIRHFVGAFVLSATHGIPGEAFMNGRENDRDSEGQADLAVNRLAFEIVRAVKPPEAFYGRTNSWRDIGKYIRERFCTG